MKETVDNHYEELKSRMKVIHNQNKAADKLSDFFGSWNFVYFALFMVLIWIIINVVAFENAWDPYPFLLLNFTINCAMFLLMPVLLMSQNRQEKKQALRTQYDYAINRKSEKEIEEIKSELDEIKLMLKKR